jgi:protein SCO1/2
MSLARPAPRRRRSSFNRFARMAAAMAVAVALAACTRDEPGWHLTNVTGHLPDLSFTLTGGDGRPVDASAFRGRVALVYFGYTHCPDVCPETMARLMEVLAKLGPRANDVRILFVSVDPARDTPQALQSYVAAFDAAHARGLTGSDGQIESLAKPPRRVPDGTTRSVRRLRGHAQLGRLHLRRPRPRAPARDRRRLAGRHRRRRAADHRHCPHHVNQT